MTTDRTYMRDGYNRYIYINGVNVSGTDKLPVTPTPTQDPRKGIPSFVGRPFPIEQADGWFKVIRSLGFNAIRLVITWESVEHAGFRQYDQDYLDYIGKIVEVAEQNNVYVLLNFHENLFSRFLYVNYNMNPQVGEPGSVENMVAKIFPDEKGLERGQVKFDSRTTGDGAPLWALKAALPEKNFDSPQWGMFKLLGNLGGPYMNFIIDEITKIINLINGGGSSLVMKPLAEGEQSFQDWITQMVAMMSNREFFNPPLVPFSPRDTTDVFPLTNWFDNNFISWDIDRGYAAFYAGDEVMPKYKFNMDGKEASIKEYLQEGYIGSWEQIARKMKGRTNILGYDLVNEPVTGYVMLAVMAAYFASDFDTAVIQNTLEKFVGPELAKAVERMIFLLNIIPLIPPRDFFEELYLEQNKQDYQAACGTSPTPACRAQYLTDHKAEVDKLIADTKKQVRADYSADDINFMGAINVNLNFTTYIVDFYDRLSKRIVAIDPNAVIWLESSGGALDSITGVNIWKPPSIGQMVYSPHWYPDIYPFLGIGSPPREFSIEEWMIQDFLPPLQEGMAGVKDSFGPVPVVYGEFGTYFNYGGVEKERSTGYRISSQILDNYYEAYEKLFVGRMLWDFSVNNSYQYGDLWNYEDFSVLGPKGGVYPTDKQAITGPDGSQYPVRGALAFERPVPHTLSGKPVEMHFYSDYHYYDPQKGVPNPWREFYLAFESKETNMPTEIYLPTVQYPDGFYVWLSDGWAQYDKANQMFYFYPTMDSPGWTHEVTIMAPQEGAEMEGFSYYFDAKGRMIVGQRQY
jgi:aryl-phospho-beta-D-glucosidase BglC (GH1 family)